MTERTKVDPATYGWTLPDGWTLSRHSVNGGEWDQWYLTGLYTARGWTVVIEANVYAPWSGPGDLHIIAPRSPEAVEEAMESDGITLEVLRAIPLGEARRVLAEWLPKVRAGLRPEEAPGPLPQRVETPHDYALVAAEYVRLVEAGERRPIHVMADACGISRNTMSARVRRAREQGLIIQDKRSHRPMAALSDKARQILDQEGSS